MYTLYMAVRQTGVIEYYYNTTIILLVSLSLSVTSTIWMLLVTMLGSMVTNLWI